MESNENISALRISIFDCDDSPGKSLKPYFPGNFKRRAWIPQSLGDCVWVLFEFESAEDRKGWEAKLPSEIANWLDRELIPGALNFGWNIRNYNGFIVG